MAHALLLAFGALCINAAAVPPPANASSSSASSMGGGGYPFNTLVAFGDQYTDDGSGSWAHGLDPDNAYGHHTYTDGAVFSTYLAQMLGVPMTNYAWGGWEGQGLPGATVDNSYTPAKDLYQGQPVPSTKQQIFEHYTGHGRPANIAHSLQVIWVGQNDIKKHTNWYAPTNKILPNNAKNMLFYKQFMARLMPQVEHLIESGAPAVVVMNFFPIHMAPANSFYFCKKQPGCAEAWGRVIEAANAHMKATLMASRYASKIIYYDVFGYMMHIMDDKSSYGFSAPITALCDGGKGNKLPVEHWDQCTRDHPAWTAARPYFWFTAAAPETHVHQYIAANLKQTIDAHFHGGSGGW